MLAIDNLLFYITYGLVAYEKSRKRAIRQTLKRNLWVEKFNASLHQLSESSGETE